MEHRDPADRKLKRVKVSLLRDDRFAYWRGIMMVGETKLLEGFPTAATDGRNEVYGKEFISQLTEKMIAFVVLHENMHKLSRDLTIWAKLFKEDMQVANMACDYRHNQLLVDMDPLGHFIEFPAINGKRIGLLDARFKGMDVPTIYRILKQEKDSGTGAFANSPNGPGENFDQHDHAAANQRQGEAKDAHEKEVDQALRQGEMEHRKVNGDKAGDLERSFKEMLQPKINWREALADFVRSVCAGRDMSSWRRPNRRYLGMDLIMPTMVSERVGHLVLGGDMSGSVGDRETTAMISEMVHIAKQVTPDKIDLLYWDTRVARHETYTPDTYDMMATSTRPAGGGGTDVNCVFDFVRNERMQPECAIILTDGYTPWPKQAPDYPVLWVITTKHITAPFGQTIHITTD